jgi:hypothetical protein
MVRLTDAGCELRYLPRATEEDVAFIASTRQIALGWLSAALLLLVSPSLVNATPFGLESLSNPAVTSDQETPPDDPQFFIILTTSVPATFNVTVSFDGQQVGPLNISPNNSPFRAGPFEVESEFSIMASCSCG